MMVSFRRVTGVSTTITNELASCEDITAPKFVSDGTARPQSGSNRVLLAAAWFFE
jgi:hypothetical protein